MICFLIRKPISIFIFKYWINIHYLPDMIPYQESNTETTYHDAIPDRKSNTEITYHDMIPYRESNIKRTFIIWDNFLLTRGPGKRTRRKRQSLHYDSGGSSPNHSLYLANNCGSASGEQLARDEERERTSQTQEE